MVALLIRLGYCVKAIPPKYHPWFSTGYVALRPNGDEINYLFVATEAEAWALAFDALLQSTPQELLVAALETVLIATAASESAVR